jgi:hypothetical protein
VKNSCKPFIGLISVEISAWTQLATILEHLREQVTDWADNFHTKGTS